MYAFSSVFSRSSSAADAAEPARQSLPAGLVGELTGTLVARWRAMSTEGRRASLAITLLALCAIGLRAWLVVVYRPAFLGFSDSSAYLNAAARGAFSDPQHPAGYPLFLRLVRHLSDSLSFTISLQHAMGIASGVLLYKSLRRLAVPRWLGLVPAALVFFGGTGVLLEHSALADPLLTFLQSVAVYAIVRALAAHDLRWPVLAGLATGASFWVKTVALSSAVLIPLVLLFAVPAQRRRRLLGASVAASVIAVTIFAYFAAQALSTGWWGYERQDAWNLYGRVATFVDCSRFTPPDGTAFLCPKEAPSRRQGENYFQYDPRAPAVERYHGPGHAPSSANAVLERFSLAAIEHEPLAYADAIARGLSYYVFPREGEGYSPQAITDGLLDIGPQRTGDSLHVRPVLAQLYPHSPGLRASAGAVSAIRWYERHTRIGGAVMVLLLAAASAGVLLPRGPARAAAVFLGLTALLSITLAVATSSYDARYAYPTFGPLAASAALGGWAAATWIKGRARLAAASMRAARARRNSGAAAC